jgi:hypothetical protein
MRFSSIGAGAAAVALTLAVSAMIPGCGAGSPEVDKSARYTPESLAGELAFRCRELKPEARKFTRATASGSRSARNAGDRELARQIEEKAEKKGGGGDVPKKRSGPPTLDDVMDDVDTKIDKIQGMPRPEVCRRMIETLSKDASLSADDKKLLSDRLKEMGPS